MTGLARKLTLCIVVLTIAGCGKSYPSVSGKVTIEGQPAPGVSILFVPVSTEENPFPGPYAEAVTASDGTFTMITRDGDKGATPGTNVVEFYSAGAMELDFLKSEALRMEAEVKGDTNHPEYQAFQDLNIRIRSLEELASGGKMKPSCSTEFAVPETGTDSANFELTKFTSTESQD